MIEEVVDVIKDIKLSKDKKKKTMNPIQQEEFDKGKNKSLIVSIIISIFTSFIFSWAWYSEKYIFLDIWYLRGIVFIVAFLSSYIGLRRTSKKRILMTKEEKEEEERLKQEEEKEEEEEEGIYEKLLNCSLFYWSVGVILFFTLFGALKSKYGIFLNLVKESEKSLLLLKSATDRLVEILALAFGRVIETLMSTGEKLGINFIIILLGIVGILWLHDIYLILRRRRNPDYKSPITDFLNPKFENIFKRNKKEDKK